LKKKEKKERKKEEKEGRKKREKLFIFTGLQKLLGARASNLPCLVDHNSIQTHAVPTSWALTYKSSVECVDLHAVYSISFSCCSLKPRH